MDPYLTRYTIGIHEVLEAHFLLLDFFSGIGEGVGGVGPKDTNLLHSALSRQFVKYGGKPKWQNRIEVCATLMFGLIKNHPFHDANKRTAFLTSLLHLQKCGRTPTASDNEYEDFLVDVSAGNLYKYKWYDETDVHPLDRDVYVVSRFLKHNTRNIDLKSKTITYNELRTILRHRGYRMENPRDNHVGIVRYLDSDGKTELGSPKRVARIGFHGWTKQVSLKDINSARKATRLDARHGYDSQSFFNELEGPLSLIKKYREPLKRLAFR